MKLVALFVTATLGALSLARPGVVADRQVVVPQAEPGQILIDHAEIGSDGRLFIDGTPVHMLGLRLPTRNQACQDRAGAVFWCGQEAQAYLDRHQAGSAVQCLVDATSVGPRGRCSLGDSDLSAMLIHSGLAWAETSVVADYVELQDRARADAQGLWR
jgi:endonuclease YncB( thermonuclease family)